MGQSSRELNKAHWQGTTPTALPSSTASPTPGSSGSAWRMSKVKRTFEAAEEEGRDIQELAIERYGSLESWNEALEERRVLDSRNDRRTSGIQRGAPSDGRKYLFSDTNTSRDPGSSSRPPSRDSFRRPGESSGRTPISSTRVSSTSQPSTPIPAVFTPPPSHTPRIQSNLSHSIVPLTLSSSSAQKPPLSQSELNRLQAKVLKARLMGNTEASKMEAEYEQERVRASQVAPASTSSNAEMLPTLDGRGRLYDIGSGKDSLPVSEPGKRKPKEKVSLYSR